ncbi:hypothetical protein PC110_g288 [Phytophthora cactorum]|uniref:Secreted protein n=1 Tax=Phytophthora cactorum TaxID=29920 RepID=A0A329T6E2_9STRA|nr:hypothetical protein PC110_g288 [Phytophthora cactorum]
MGGGLLCLVEVAVSASGASFACSTSASASSSALRYVMTDTAVAAAAASTGWSLNHCTPLESSLAVGKKECCNACGIRPRALVCAKEEKCE